MDQNEYKLMSAELENTARTLATSASSRGWSRESSDKFAQRIATFADRSIKMVQQGSAVLACAPGCNYCCHLAVSATPWEMVRLANVVAEWPDVQKQELIDRLMSYCDLAAPHRAERFTRFRAPCPLLVEGLCSAYEARPLACRGRVSEDVDVCKMHAESANEVASFKRTGEQTVVEALNRGATMGGDAEFLELAQTLLEVLTVSGSLDRLVSKPASFVQNYTRPWHSRLLPKGQDPLGPVEAEAWADEFLTTRRTAPFAEAFAKLDRNTTFGAVLSLDLPSLYSDVADRDHWRRQFDDSIEHAYHLQGWQANQAYHALLNVRPLALGYQPGPLLTSMKAFGRLLTERIAAKVAPELLEPLGKRRPGVPRVGFIGAFGDNSASRWSLGWVKDFNVNGLETHVLKVFGTEDAESFGFRDIAFNYRRLAGHPLEIARYIRSLDLDYLIYPDLGDTWGIFQYAIFRLARRQAGAWGCPFTSGLEEIDDFLSAELMEPPEAQGDYSENLVRLPNCGVNLKHPSFRPGDLSRGLLGLPEGRLVSFPQYVIKWPVDYDAALVKIVSKSNNPLVLFKMGTQREQSAFQQRMDQHGVPTLWLPAMALPRFRQTLRLFDSLLDGPGWSGGLTAFHCMGEKAPFVNLPGPYLRQRLAKGFVERAGGAELCAPDIEAYIRLATDWEKLDEIRNNLSPDCLYEDSSAGAALAAHIKNYVDS